MGTDRRVDSQVGCLNKISQDVNAPFIGQADHFPSRLQAYYAKARIIITYDYLL